MLEFIKNPEKGWKKENVQLFPSTQPVYGYGTIIYVNNEDFNLKLEALDFHTGETKWSKPFNDDISEVQNPLLFDGVLYISTSSFSNSKLFAIDCQTGSLIWYVNIPEETISPAFLAPGYIEGKGFDINVVYVTSKRGIYAIPVADISNDNDYVDYVNNHTFLVPKARKVYSSDIDFAVSIPIFDQPTESLIFGTSRGLRALRINSSGTDFWTQQWEVDFGGYVTSPTSTGTENIYVGVPGNKMAIVNVETGKHILSESLSNPIDRPITVYQNQAYVPTRDGKIHLLDSITARRKDKFDFAKEQVTTPIFISDNVGYFGCQDGNVYMFDIESPNTTVSRYETGTAIDYLTKVTNGVAYFGGQNAMYAVRFRNIYKAFTCHSQLMVDYCRSNTSENGGIKQIPTFRTHITLYDKHNNIRPNENVKIWAAEPTNITLGGKSRLVGPETPVGWISDATGMIEFTMEPKADFQIDKKGNTSGISAPMLTLWADFMQPLERIVVFPDQQMHQNLQNITGKFLLSLHNFFDNILKAGQPMLPKSYNEEKAEIIATAIRNIGIGAERPTISSNTEDRYLAYPNSMIGVTYLSSPSLSTVRPIYPGKHPNWELDLGDPDNPIFKTYSSADEINKLILDYEQQLYGGFGIFGDIGDFAKDVYHRGEKVVKFVVKKVKEGAETVVYGTKKAYKFVVDTAEKAVALTMGMLKSIKGAIDDVANTVRDWLKALSGFFSWKDIIAFHDDLNDRIHDMITENVPKVINDIRNQTAGFFDNLENSIERSIDKIITQIDGTTMGSYWQGYTDPAVAFNTGGNTHALVQSQWLLSKIKIYSGGTQSYSYTSGMQYSNTEYRDAGDEFKQEFEEFLKNAKKVILAAGDVGKDAVAVAEEIGKILWNTVTGNKSLGSIELKDLLEKVKELAKSLIRLTGEIVDFFFKLLLAVLKLIYTLLSAPINIPVISDLYKFLTGKELSILDVGCLLIAIPVTIICKATTNSAPRWPSKSRIKDAMQLQEWDSKGFHNILIISQVMAGFSYVGLDAVKSGITVSGATSQHISQGVVVVLLAQQIVAETLYSESPPPSSATTEYLILWMAHFLPVALEMAGGMGVVPNKVTTFAGTGFGMVRMGAYAYFAYEYPDDYFDNGFALVQNEAAAISDVSKIGLLSTEPNTITVVTSLSTLCNLINALMGLKYLK